MSWRDRIANAILGGKVGGPTPTGIHVYHSSPHDFDKFDLSKIGTGEGAQVYGHGIYAAENPAVSGQGGQYWGQFLQRFPKDDMRAAEYLKQHGFDRDAAAASLRAEIARQNAATPYGNLTRDVDSSHYDKLRERLGLLESGTPVGPRTYEVNFRAKPEELLDWDKRLTEQPAVVQDFARRADLSHLKEGNRSRVLIEKYRTGAEQPEYPATGQVFYHGLMHGLDKPPASAALNEAGIPGIRYLDEGSRAPARDAERTIAAANRTLEHFRNPSRNVALDEQFIMGPLGTPEGAIKLWEGELARALQPNRSITHNYVAFDPSRLDIMAKYGVVGGVPLGAATMGGTIDQSTYGERQ